MTPFGPAIVSGHMTCNAACRICTAPIDDEDRTMTGLRRRLTAAMAMTGMTLVASLASGAPVATGDAARGSGGDVAIAQSRDAGATAPQALAEAEREVRELAAGGRKIEAIRRVRELTGVGLKEAKDWVDRLPDAPPLASLMAQPPEISAELREELRALLAAGRKIDAITLCRERTGLDLVRAKQIVDRLDQ